jgi:hypothetical protein
MINTWQYITFSTSMLQSGPADVIKSELLNMSNNSTVCDILAKKEKVKSQEHILAC